MPPNGKPADFVPAADSLWLPDFSHIEFSREQHVYCSAGVPLISATTVISELKPAFDRDGISQRVALRDGLSQEEVLAQWEQKSLDALAKGSALHSYIEDLFKRQHSDSVVESMNGDVLPELAGFKKAWARLEKSHGAKIERQEMIVGDEELGVAGTVDAIVSFCPSASGQPQAAPAASRHIFDWKTGRKFESSNKYEKLLAPFDDLDNCHLSMYSLQTSLYRLILERAARRQNIEMRFGDSYLVHLRASGSHYSYRGRDYRGRLEEWLMGRPRAVRVERRFVPAVGAEYF